LDTIKNVVLALILAALCAPIFHCATEISDGGSGTGTGNPVIIGKVYNQNGSPASNARVLLRRTDFLKDTSLARLQKEYIDSNDTVTGNDGTFRFTNVDTGRYFIEAAAKNNAPYAMLFTCQITKYDKEIKLAGDTLRPMEHIIGNASLYGGPNAKKYVQVYGLDRVVEADAAGDFKIPVPNGTYSLMIVAASSEYDNVAISSVESNDVPLSIKMLSDNPVSDSWICDTLIVRAILDSNELYDYEAEFFITMIENGRIYQLDMEHPSLHTIPSIIGGLHTLKDLEIQYSSVDEVPSRIGELIDLKELELNGNMLRTLPIEITNIQKLTECRLEKNRLKNLPPAVKNWADKFDPGWETTQDTTSVGR